VNKYSLLKLAIAELRHSSLRILLVTLSFAFGVMLLTALRSIGNGVEETLERESKSLLGADIALSNSSPIPEPVLEEIARRGGELSREITFASMLVQTRSNTSRLVQVRALSGRFPFYGEVITEPAGMLSGELAGQADEILLDQSVVAQLQSTTGEKFRIGERSFSQAGTVLKFPGTTYARTMIAPSVFVRLEEIEGTGLLQRGSRVTYKYMVRLPDAPALAELSSWLLENQQQHGYEIDTVEKRKESLGTSFRNASRYIDLVGFVSLLLGGIGVASAIYSHFSLRRKSMAALRCLGLTNREVVSLFLWQVLLVAIAGSFAGIILATMLGTVVTTVFADFLPVELMTTISPLAMLEGYFYGIVVAGLAASLSLSTVSSISPLEALRSASLAPIRSNKRILGALSAVTVLYLLSTALSRSFLGGAIFSGAVMIVAGILYLLSALLLNSLRRWRVDLRSFVIRQAISALHRPNNQSAVTFLTVGLGTFLLVTVGLTQTMLLEEVRVADRHNRPNLILFDVQLDQREAIRDTLAKFSLPILQEVPIVTMRLSTVNGKSNRELRADSEIPEWTLRREYRSTYRGELIDSEALVEGNFSGKFESTNGVIPISAEEGIAKNLKIKLGDELVFDVQGVLITTRITSIRKVQWRRVQTNFFFVFPRGALEDAPQFFAFTTRAKDPQLLALAQRELTTRFGNVSSIDLNLILQTVDTVLEKVTIAIRFLALFAIAAGIMVLVSAMATTRAARLRESLLLRALGATRREVLRMSFYEHLILGSGAVAIGLGLALLATWGLSLYLFEVLFTPDWLSLACSGGGVVAVVLILGLLTTFFTVRTVPAAVLRVGLL